VGSFRSIALLCTLPLIATPQSIGTVLTRDDVPDEHSGEPPGMSDDAWWGLYVDGDSSWVGETVVEWIRGSDPDEPRFSISTEPPDPILLVTGVPGLRPGSAETVILFTTGLSSSSPALDLVVGGRAYVVALSGSDPMGCDAVVTVAEGDLTQTLYTPADSPFDCDEPHFDVHWAGDLDGDGRLDLAATFSSKYSHHPRRLYLSSAAAGHELLGHVASFDR
jgi:hypothetical protein